MNDWVIGAATVAVAIVVFICGWLFAHNTVARECDKLGAFYVGQYVYECKVKDKNGGNT